MKTFSCSYWKLQYIETFSCSYWKLQYIETFSDELKTRHDASAVLLMKIQVPWDVAPGFLINSDVLEECIATVFRVEQSENSLLELPTLQMEALHFPDTFVIIYHSAWCNVPSDLIFKMGNA